MDTRNKTLDLIEMGVGLLWSIVAIVVPAYAVAIGVVPQLALGALIGATIRFGTDLVLVAMGADGSEGYQQFSSRQLPIVVVSVVVQFGTLITAGVLYAMNGSTLAFGIAAIMLMTYAVGFLIKKVVGLFRSDEQDASSDDQEQEWEFGVDDV